MIRNSFVIADAYAIKNTLLQIQEQLRTYTDYTEFELQMLIRFLERKKEENNDLNTWIGTMYDENTNKEYEWMYRSVANSIVEVFRDSYQLACDLIHELGQRLEKLQNPE